jgi:hypothetical protein
VRIVVVVPVKEHRFESWSDQWTRGVLESTPAGIPVSIRESAYSPSPEPGTLYVLSRYHLFAEPPQLDRYPDRSVFLVEHGADTAWTTGYRARVEPASYRHRAVRAVLVPTPSMAAFHRKRYGIPRDVPVVPVGFPYPRSDVPVFGIDEPTVKDDRLVVFPQRIDDDTEPHLAAALGEALVERGHRVVFSTNYPPDPRWPVDLYATDLGIDVRLGTTGEDYRSLLRSARFAVSTARGTLCMAGYEAWLSGCIPIVPRGPGCFGDSYRLRFDPLDALSTLLGAMGSGRRQSQSGLIDESWYLPEMFWARLGTFL